jgi:hypothetical protein
MLLKLGIGVEKGGALGFLVVGHKSKQTMFCPLVKVKEQNI